jgi:hypothetical protein
VVPAVGSFVVVRKNGTLLKLAKVVESVEGDPADSLRAAMLHDDTELFTAWESEPVR